MSRGDRVLPTQLPQAMSRGDRVLPTQLPQAMSRGDHVPPTQSHSFFFLMFDQRFYVRIVQRSVDLIHSEIDFRRTFFA